MDKHDILAESYKLLHRASVLPYDSFIIVQHLVEYVKKVLEESVIIPKDAFLRNISYDKQIVNFKGEPLKDDDFPMFIKLDAKFEVHTTVMIDEHTLKEFEHILDYAQDEIGKRMCEYVESLK